MTGVSVPHISDEQIGSFRVPAAAMLDDPLTADRLEDVQRRTETLVAPLRSQISLLQEHRQALITAAVTGELEIPGAAA